MKMRTVFFVVVCSDRSSKTVDKIRISNSIWMSANRKNSKPFRTVYAKSVCFVVQQHLLCLKFIQTNAEQKERYGSMATSKPYDTTTSLIILYFYFFIFL